MRFYVDCPNDKYCSNIIEVDLEHEECGDGTTHECKCDKCGVAVEFDIEYRDPVAGNERIREEG